MCPGSIKHKFNRIFLTGTLILAGSFNDVHAQFDTSTIQSASIVCIKGAFYTLHESANPPKKGSCEIEYESKAYGAFEEDGIVRGIASVWDETTKSHSIAMVNAYNTAGSLFLALNSPYGPRAKKRQALLNLDIGVVNDVSNPSGKLEDLGWSVNSLNGMTNPFFIREFSEDALKAVPTGGYETTQVRRGNYGELLDDTECKKEPGTACAVTRGLRETLTMVGEKFIAPVSDAPVGFNKKFPLSVPLLLSNLNGACSAVESSEDIQVLIRENWLSNGFKVSKQALRELESDGLIGAKVRVNTFIFLMPTSTPTKFSRRSHHKVILSEVANCDASAPYQSTFYVLDTTGQKLGMVNADRPTRADFLVNFAGMSYFAKTLQNFDFDFRIAKTAAYWASAIKSAPVYNR